jgi:predicted esterase
MPSNDKNNNIIDRREWWMLPPGVRSFQAKEYIGFEDSALLVENALTNQKYDFLLGHSQGAILASILMTTSSIFSSNHTQRPYGCILNGVAWPNPFQEHLHHYATNPPEKPILNTTKALLIIGKMDDINPPEGGEKVRDIFKDSGKISVETIYHENGHSFPTHDPMTMEAICNWIISTSSHSTTTRD